MGRPSLLFTPVAIGSLKVKNRIVMAPMTSGHASDEGFPTEALTGFYVERAEGGTGLIIIESCYVDKGGKGFTGQLGVDHDEHVAPLSHFVEAIQSAGSRLALQLIHCGRQTSSAICGTQPVAASPIPCPLLREMPRALTLPEIQETIDHFISAAVRAKAAGFDAVEIHGAHGYLLNQFLSGYSNKRTDAYGGSLLNRCRILFDIVTGIRRELGEEYPILCRLSAEEFVPGGLTLEESSRIAAWLENVGVNALHVSGGVYESAHRVIPTMDAGQGSLAYLAEKIKAKVSIPVIAVGGIHDPEYADRLLVEGKADLIAIGRSLMADGHYPTKVDQGQTDRIRPCIYCNQCRNRKVRPASRCAVNYAAFREISLKGKPAPARAKSVAVIGGGIAGMEAARICAVRGHEVILFEKANRLGGNLILAGIPPKRDRLNRLLEYLKDEVEVLNIQCRLNTPADMGTLRDLNPDAVLLATGARQAVPDIKGIDSGHVLLATDVLGGDRTIGGHVVIVGGGLVGLETADYLRVRGTAVTIVEQLPDVAADDRVEAIFRSYLLKRLTATDQPVLVLTSSRVLEIGPQDVVIEQSGVEKRLPAVDAVVLAVGFRPELPFDPDTLRGDYEVHIIGDASGPSTIFEAIHSAAEVAYSL